MTRDTSPLLPHGRFHCRIRFVGVSSRTTSRSCPGEEANPTCSPRTRSRSRWGHITNAATPRCACGETVSRNNSALIDQAGLRFGRWERQASYLPDCGAISETPHAKRIATLPAVEQYALVELFRATIARHTADRGRRRWAGTTIHFTCVMRVSARPRTIARQGQAFRLDRAIYTCYCGRRITPRCRWEGVRHGLQGTIAAPRDQ